jgi:hypothetical protein
VKVLRHFCVAIIFGVLFFDFRAQKYLSLEPLLKLATFIDRIITGNCQNILKKFEKLPAAAVFAAAK